MVLYKTYIIRIRLHLFFHYPITQIITIMTGEINFDNMFFPVRAEITPKRNMNITVNNGETISLPYLKDADITTFSKAQYYPGTVHFLGMFIVLLCSIVIMNLIVGLAVDDVGVRKSFLLIITCYVYEYNCIQ